MHSLLPKITYRVLKPNLKKNLHVIKSLNQLKESRLREYQLNRLKNLINYTYQQNEFYRTLWTKNKVSLNIETLDDLKNFPTVTKSDLVIAATNNSHLSRGFESEKLHIDYTTGSTGNPFKVYKNQKCYEFHYAQYIAAKISTGYQIGDREVRLWRGPLKPTSKDKFKTLLTGKSTICIYDPDKPAQSRLTQDRLTQIIDELFLIKPKFIDGYVSALVQLSEYILKYNLDVTFSKAIYTGAEALTDTGREVIETAFKCPVYNRYGGTEFGLLGHECQSSNVEKRVLHTTCSASIIENDPETKEIIVTDLYNFAMPLIRYRTGDVGELSSKKCLCGGNTRTLKNITGRVNDSIKFKDGSTISSHIWHNFIKKYQNVKNYQIIQHDFEKFTVKLDLADNNARIGEIQERIANALTVDVKLITWEIGADNIEVGAGGKNRQCISHLN